MSKLQNAEDRAMRLMTLAVADDWDAVRGEVFRCDREDLIETIGQVLLLASTLVDTTAEELGGKGVDLWRVCALAMQQETP